MAKPLHEIPPSVASGTFQDLVAWIANEFHEGVVLGIAKKLGISSAAPYFWLSGNTKAPHTTTVSALAEAYHLDVRVVMRCVAASKTRPTSDNKRRWERRWRKQITAVPQ